MMKVDQISHEAALALRHGIEIAISHLESELKLKLPSDLSDDVCSYFEMERKGNLTAIADLKALRAACHHRAFDTYETSVAFQSVAKKKAKGVV